MKKFKMLNWFFKVELNPYNFAVENKKASIYKKYFYLWIFIIVSLISLTSTFLLSILSSLKLAKLWIFSENVKETTEVIKKLLNNYVYVVNTLNSIISFVSTLIAFFSFKNGYLKNRNIAKKLNFEILQFDNKMGFYVHDDKKNELLLIDRVSYILDNEKSISVKLYT